MFRENVGGGAKFDRQVVSSHQGKIREIRKFRKFIRKFRKFRKVQKLGDAQSQTNID